MFVNHWHVAPAGTFDKNDPEKGTLAAIRKTMDEYGIEKTIAFAPFMHCMPNDTWYNIPLKDERECNEWLFNSLKEYRGIIGFVTVNPSNPEACDIVTEYITKGFRGVKMHPAVFQAQVDDPAYSDYYSTIEKLNVPVLFHTGSHGWIPEKYRPSRIANVAKNYPGLKIIVEHTGGTDNFEEAMMVIKENPNCYAGVTSTFIKIVQGGIKNSSYLSPERLLSIVETVGAGRMIYGTDFPFNNINDTKYELDFIGSLKISDLEKEYILGKTLETLVEN